jgi:hypothetical protein
MDFLTRAALSLGCAGFVALASGCGAPSETETKAKGDQALIYLPIQDLTPPLSAETGGPTPNGSTCGSTSIAPPTSLAGFDCTWGVEVLSDPDLKESSKADALTDPYVAAPTGESVQAYAWACHPATSSGASIDDTLSTVVNATDTLSAFGGPAVVTEYPIFVRTVTYTDSCFGTADTGYVLVLETFRDGRRAKPGGGCDGDDCGSGGTGSGSGGGDVGSGSGGFTLGNPVLKI